MKVLVDTDVLIALAKNDDANHSRAIALFKKHRKALLYVSALCIPEAATVLSYKVSNQAAGKFLRDIRARQIHEISLSQSLTALSDSIFLAQRSKGISWIDCCNVALMQLESLDAIASFDRFYRQQNLQILV